MTFLGLPIDVPEILRQCVDQFFKNLKIPPHPRHALGIWPFDAKGFPEGGGFKLYPSGVGTDFNFKCQVFSGGIHVIPDPRTSSRGKCRF